MVLPISDGFTSAAGTGGNMQTPIGNAVTVDFIRSYHNQSIELTIAPRYPDCSFSTLKRRNCVCVCVCVPACVRVTLESVYRISGRWRQNSHRCCSINALVRGLIRMCERNCTQPCACMCV